MMENAQAVIGRATESKAGTRVKKIVQGFKDFISQGSALDLAIGVVIGAAFTSVISAITDHFINPLIGAIFGAQDLTNIWTITLRTVESDTGEVIRSEISVGHILDASFKFLLTAFVIYLFIVVPMNRLRALRKAGAEPEPEAPPADILLLQEIRDLLAKGEGTATTSATAPPTDPPAGK